MFKYKVFLILLSGVWIVFTGSLLSISLPRNPASNSFYKYKPMVQVFFPEGWGFFTKNPREERTYFFIKEGKKWIQDPRLRNARLVNGWGIIRTGRKINLIYETDISAKISRTFWIKVPDYIFFKRSGIYIPKPIVITIKKSNSYLIPKEILILRKEIIPWALRGFEKQAGINIYYCLVEIKCE